MTGRVLLVLLLLLGVTGCTTHSDDPPSATAASYALPTNGWNGGPALDALIQGRLHGVVRHGQACAWLGDHEIPTLWPKGYRLRLHPLEVVDAHGELVAHEGEWLSSGGGHIDGHIATACATSRPGVVSLMGVRRSDGPGTPSAGPPSIP